jgi:hypothetical protein
VTKHRLSKDTRKSYVWLMTRLYFVVLVLASSALSACAVTSPTSRGYQINTSDVTCDDANRYVQQTLDGMGMRITDFRKARPGAPGYAKAARASDEGGSLKGSVDIACDDAGVHIVPDQAGFLNAQEFERGFFLSMTGRAGLVVEREGRDSTGRVHKREDGTPARTADAGGVETVQTGNDAGTPTPFSENTEGGMEVQIELVRGFATVLDFEANVSAVGILPVKITVENKTSRTYDFNPREVALRKDGTADRIEPLTASAAVSRLKSGKDGDAKKHDDEKAKEEGNDPTPPPPPPPVPGGASVDGLGDVEAASRLLPEREIKKARLEPGKQVSGYLYFPDGKYDRARVTMTDVATGETEGFLVEF